MERIVKLIALAILLSMVSIYTANSKEIAKKNTDTTSVKQKTVTTSNVKSATPVPTNAMVTAPVKATITGIVKAVNEYENQIIVEQNKRNIKLTTNEDSTEDFNKWKNKEVVIEYTKNDDGSLLVQTIKGVVKKPTVKKSSPTAKSKTKVIKKLK